jgi:hypothetical protein
MSNQDWELKFRTLVKELEDIDSSFGIYPAAVQGYNDERDYEHRDGFKNGWNAAITQYGQKFREIVYRAEECVQDDDLQMLLHANVGWVSDGKLSINMNDTWSWASSWAEPVPTDDVREVARLYRRYGFAGLLYWASEKNDKMRSEFHDINRQIEFVRKEEEIRTSFPSSNERAYKKVMYTIGVVEEGENQ